MEEAYAQAPGLPDKTSPQTSVLNQQSIVNVEEEKLVGENLEELYKEKRCKMELEKEENYQVGKWTKEEHTRFMDAFNAYGKNWKKIQESVATRSITQVRSHAQKCLPGANTSHRKSKDVNNSEHPETTQKEVLPKSRKRTQSSKIVSNTKKAKINHETSQVKSDPYTLPGIVLYPTELLASSNATCNGSAEILFSSAMHYVSVANEAESRNDGQDFEFDFSEAEIKPLNLDERESNSLWRDTEGREIPPKLFT